ncbi:MAG: hypothetical protein JNM93_06200 [Bacteriovoracaceae bacterium]|nr:hypothetical protein [Bacteriovoracaceae bacterium]
MKTISLLVLGFYLTTFLASYSQTNLTNARSISSVEELGDQGALVRQKSNIYLVKNIKTTDTDEEVQVVLTGKIIAGVKIYNRVDIINKDKKINKEQLETLNYETIKKLIDDSKEVVNEFSYKKEVVKVFKNQNTVHSLTLAGITAKSEENTNKSEKKKFGPTVVNASKKSAAFITTATTRPIAYVTGLVTGTFDNKMTATERTSLLFLNRNRNELNAFMLMNQNKSLNSNLEEIETLVSDLAEKEFTTKYEADLEKLGAEILVKLEAEGEISAEFINNNPHFQGVKAEIGALTQEQIDKLIDIATFSDEIGLEELREAGIITTQSGSDDEESAIDEKKYIAEGAVIGIGQIALSSAVFAKILGILGVAKGAGWIGFAATIGVDVATYFIAKDCLKKQENAEMSEEDLEVCGYVLNRGVRKIGKSYLSGKGTGIKFRDSIKARNLKRQEKKKAKEV